MTPREEIEQAARLIEAYQIPCSASTVDSIREILATHKLVPIDETPFDPERCGGEPDATFPYWNFPTFTLRRSGTKLALQTHDFTCEILVPWPAKHSDGVRLLQLLGLEVRT